ncbi:MAG: RagB/SusD family nutrient uptake outer membrane protein [Bacteroidota bacterium]
MKILTLRAAALLLLVGSLAGCDLFTVDDESSPNGPALEDILADPSIENLSAVALGVEAASRVDLDLYLIDVGVIGREYWRTSNAEPRFTGDLLGRGTSVLDDNTFYITRPWNARYRVVRNANILLQLVESNAALENAVDRLAAEEASYARGYAKTWKAYQYLLNLNLTFENGLRFIGVGEEVAGPVESYDASLAQIAALLDEGLGDLEGSASFFGTTVDITYMNRAVAARVAAYRGDFSQVLALLADAFDVDGIGAADLGSGVAHLFSTGGGDLTNPVFFPPTNAVGDAILAHPSYANEIEEGDTRIDKVEQRLGDDGEPTVSSFDELASQFSFFRYKSVTDGVPVTRNAELVLLRAEARAQTGDLAGAIADLNTIRNAAGLADYSGASEQSAVVDEMLRQRRYELYGEGHRWVDTRRYDRLSTLPIDRQERTDRDGNVIEADDVWDRFPIPATENVGS